MTCKIICYLCILAIPAVVNGVKVNMQGSVSLGKDVMETITNYFRRGAGGLSGRRAMPVTFDAIALQVKSMSFCHDLNLCKGPFYKFLNEYVTALAKAAESVFIGVFNEKAGKDLETATPIISKLDGCMRGIKKILKKANKKLTQDNVEHIWLMLVKKISGRFQNKILTYIVDKLTGKENEIVEIRKRLSQKTVIAIAETESIYQKSLCRDHRICLRTMECTKNLNTVLETLANQSDEKVKAFIRAFYELMPETNFYTRLNDVTANEFQVILNNMSFGNNVPTKEVLATVQKIVKTRLDQKTNEEVKPSVDVLLVHVILSDMDYFYSNDKSEPFHAFLNDFIEWTRNGGRVNPFMKKAIKSMQDTILGSNEELTIKMTYEVRVFLEITVDPESGYS